MATRTWVKLATSQDGPIRHYHLDAPLEAGDVAAALKIGHRERATAHFVGTFGGAVTLRGSNLVAPDPATAGDWATMTDRQGNNIAPTAAAFEGLQDIPLWLSALAAAGVGSVDIFLLVGSVASRTD